MLKGLSLGLGEKAVFHLQWVEDVLPNVLLIGLSGDDSDGQLQYQVVCVGVVERRACWPCGIHRAEFAQALLDRLLTVPREQRSVDKPWRCSSCGRVGGGARCELRRRDRPESTREYSVGPAYPG